MTFLMFKDAIQVRYAGLVYCITFFIVVLAVRALRLGRH